eukprot:TRINITY_DN61783_c0_g1_i2.p1 TRINITY_DN61783_c0_g1~~TRINITY_DN61783_c0_g1_i2.p1  ORF type:complete len:212 (-),score=37.04 TRINITY_DN61783_c0_g1_i2:245-880(-)
MCIRDSFGRCFQDGDSTIRFNAVCLPENFNMTWQHELWLSNSSEAPGILYDFEIHLNSNQVSWDRCCECSCEFPAVHPYRHVPNHPPRYTYLMAADSGFTLPYLDIVKTDSQGTNTSKWHSDGKVVGEPCFVPRLGYASAAHGDEDDGWIITQVYDHERHATEFVILDAQSLNTGPVCTLHMNKFIPYAFHGTFVPDVFRRKPPTTSLSKL